MAPNYGWKMLETAISIFIVGKIVLLTGGWVSQKMLIVFCVAFLWFHVMLQRLGLRLLSKKFCGTTFASYSPSFSSVQCPT